MTELLLAGEAFFWRGAAICGCQELRCCELLVRRNCGAAVLLAHFGLPHPCPFSRGLREVNYRRDHEWIRKLREAWDGTLGRRSAKLEDGRGAKRLCHPVAGLDRSHHLISFRRRPPCIRLALGVTQARVLDQPEVLQPLQQP
jgi:hypothetical protein